MSSEQLKEKLSPTEKDVVDLGKYLFDVAITFSEVINALKTNNSLKEFSGYEELEKSAEEVWDIRDELMKYKNVDAVWAKQWLRNSERKIGYAYKVAIGLEKYKMSRDKRGWEDGASQSLDHVKGLSGTVKKIGQILYRLYDKKELEPEIRKKYKSTPEKTVIAIIAIISVTFIGFTMMGNAGYMSTGFASMITADAISANFEMIYVVISSVILSTYFMGKVFKRW